LRILGASLVGQRRWSEALEALDRAAAISRTLHELADRLARIDLARAHALAGQRKIVEAIALARRAREVLKRFPGDLRARADADAFLAAMRRRTSASGPPLRRPSSAGPARR
jgi:hypothetical protein